MALWLHMLNISHVLSRKPVLVEKYAKGAANYVQIY